jgi:hypothetical protein
MYVYIYIYIYIYTYNAPCVTEGHGLAAGRGGCSAKSGKSISVTRGSALRWQLASHFFEQLRQAE